MTTIARGRPVKEHRHPDIEMRLLKARPGFLVLRRGAAAGFILERVTDPADPNQDKWTAFRKGEDGSERTFRSRNAARDYAGGFDV